MAIPYSRYIFGHIPWYSFLIVLGILLAFFLGSKEEKRLGLPQDTMIDVTLVAVPCGIVGSRLYFVLMSLPRFLAHPVSILYIWEGGVAIYGAVIGGAVGVYVYCRKKKLPFLKIVDMVVPGLLLAQAIGRWGNYFNMEAYGPAIGDARLQFFPVGVLILESGAPVWHMATFFYESLWAFFGFLALMLLRKGQKRDGNLFFWYLLLYGSGRFIIEQLRTDSLYLGGIRVSQYLSLILCALAAGALLWRAAKGRPGRAAWALGITALSLARWFLLLSGAYIACPVALLGLGAFLLLKDGLPRENRSPTALWQGGTLLALCLLDGLSALLLPPAGLGHALHVLCCSVTLPCYVLWFQRRLPTGAETGEPAKPLAEKPAGE